MVEQYINERLILLIILFLYVLSISCVHLSIGVARSDSVGDRLAQLHRRAQTYYEWNKTAECYTEQSSAHRRLHVMFHRRGP